MTKKTKTADELQAMVVALVRRNSEYSLVTPGKPYWHERDSEGCNWDLTSWTGKGLDVAEAANEIASEVRLLRKKYDLEFPS
jgi:hypothetical protein